MGAIFGLEVSRLARPNADFARLLELARLTDTPVIDTIRAAVPALPPRAELEALATDLPALWNASTSSAKDRKRLMRTLVADVTLTCQLGGRRSLDRNPVAFGRLRAHRDASAPAAVRDNTYAEQGH